MDNDKEQPQRLVTFETFDQSDMKTWPDQKNIENDNHIQHPKRAIPKTCDRWDTDNISDNLEQQSQHS